MACPSSQGGHRKNVNRPKCLRREPAQKRRRKEDFAEKKITMMPAVIIAPRKSFDILALYKSDYYYYYYYAWVTTNAEVCTEIRASAVTMLTMYSWYV